MVESGDQDLLQRFVFAHADVRGEVVRLEQTFAETVARHDYDPAIRSLVGEGLAAVALLAATLKYPCSLNLQLQSPGPLSLLLIQGRTDGTMRAMARTRESVPEQTSLDALAPEGTLAILIEPLEGGERYQGVVDLRGGSLASALEHYFRESEQLPTRVWLSAQSTQAAGMLIQRLPAEGGHDSRDDDAWQRAGMLAETVTGEELRALPPREMIRRLFHEEDLRLFDPTPLRFACRCSRDRVAAMLEGLGEAEMRATLADEGIVEVHCDFCNAPYRFDAVDIEALFTDPAVRSPESHESH